MSSELKPKESERSLTVMRAMLDSIDRDVLQLLARRMGVVAEIAAHKRSNSVRIRDLDRERSILRDRCDRAENLGLPAGNIESIWRLLMLMSRDKQAELRAEVPLDVESKTVTVIGANGGMGQLLQRTFGDLGHVVLSVDVDTKLTWKEAVKSSDVVIISVPIRDTVELIRDIGPFMHEDALLMDITSLKGEPLAAMMESTRASVVGTHPMFGPGVHTLTGQRIVMCKGRGDAWYEWARTMFAARGLVITESSAEEHDRAMAIVQVLHHYKTQVVGVALSRLSGAVEESLRFTSPAYLLEAYVTARHFAQSPALYGPIEMMNPATGAVTDTFRAVAEEVALVLRRGDQAAFDSLFDEVRSFFGAFTDEALQQSGFLIDRLVELSAGRSTTA